MSTEYFTALHTASTNVYFRFYKPSTDQFFDFDDDTWKATPVDEKLVATEKTAAGDGSQSLYVAGIDLADLVSAGPTDIVVQIIAAHDYERPVLRDCLE